MDIARFTLSAGRDKMILVWLLCCWISLVHSLGLNTSTPPPTVDPFFRSDYHFLRGSGTFYKEHRGSGNGRGSGSATWADAVAVCAGEGAALVAPRTETEVTEILEQISPDTARIWLGIHDVYAEGEFVTLDGKPLSDIHSKWGPNEPNDSRDEDCVTVDREGFYYDTACKKKYNFVCKKELSSVTSNPACDTYDTAYFYKMESGRCYKLHTTARTWHEAYKMCKLEQSQLVILNSPEEAAVLTEVLGQYPASSLKGTFDKDVVHMGFNELLNNGVYMTIEGVSLSQSGYDEWAPGQPDNSGARGEEHCGAMARSGRLHDVNCHTQAMFFCERAPGTINDVSQHSRFKSDFTFV